MADKNKILQLLPYTKPFLFVDELISVTDSGSEGIYTFKKNEYFYKGHFQNKPITPGVILTECMAQIGLVCMGIHLFQKENISEHATFVLSETAIDFYKPVFPGERVKVVSEKIYYRFQKLKCKVIMYNGNEEVVCKGTIAGMILKKEQLENNN